MNQFPSSCSQFPARQGFSLAPNSSPDSVLFPGSRFPVLSSRNQELRTDLKLAALKGAHFIILGLGRAGYAAARALLKAGALISGYDDNAQIWETPKIKSLLAQGLKRWENLNLNLAPTFTVIASPGFPSSHNLIRFFEDRGVPVLDELDFASQFLPGPIIAVTGTNGKSTTVAMIAAILKQAGSKVFMGGNLAPGRPLSDALLLKPRDYYVVEISSFQLQRSRFIAPKIAVILNITPDHLDRHKTFANYVRAKAQILKRQTENDWAVLNYDDPTVRKMAHLGRAKKIFFSTRRLASVPRSAFRLPLLLPLPLPLPVHLDNAIAAITAVSLLGVSPRAIKAALKKFKGLKHRLEVIRCRHGVTYINNSMCTNPASGIRCLETFPKKVILITGGKEKNLMLRDYLKTIVRRTKWVILLGENSPKLSAGLTRLGFHRWQIVQTMRDAVQTASQKATPGDIVLLSPGFASFDMFSDFQARGRAFKNEVNRL
jgi:UDP-N-acetylmuramoylalanine--D-glutamate ligase